VLNVCLILFSITRTFASGKTEKGIFQALKDLGLPSGKVMFNSTYFLSDIITYMKIQDSLKFSFIT